MAPIDWTNYPGEKKSGIDWSGYPEAPSPTPKQEGAKVKPEDHSDLRALAGGGTRLVSSFLSGEGGPLGAATSALGEGAAEMIEGSAGPWSTAPLHQPKLGETPSEAFWHQLRSDVMAPIGRMGIAAGVGAIPAASIAKGGALLRALKGGAITGASTAATQAVEGKDLDPSSIGLAAGIGGAASAALPPVARRLGGALSRFLGRGEAPTTVPSPETYQVEPTPFTGEGTSAPTKVTQGGVIKQREQIRPIRPIKGEGVPAIPEGPMPEPKAPIPAGFGGPAVGGPAGRSAAAAQKIADKQEAAQRLLQEAQDAGYTLGDPRYSTGESGVTEEGLRVSKGQALVPPKPGRGGRAGGITRAQQLLGLPPSPADDLAAQVQEAVRSGQAPEASTAPSPSSISPLVKEVSPGTFSYRPSDEPMDIEEVNRLYDEFARSIGLTPEEASKLSPDDILPARPSAPPTTLASPPTPSEPGAEPLSFFRTAKGATGKNYRLAQEAAAAGEIPSSDFARDTHLIQQGKTPEGPLADFLGVSKGAEAPSEAPDWVQNQLDAIDRLKGQKGEIDPRLLRLFGAGTGALIGAPIGAHYDEQDPLYGGLKGALAGGIIGGAIVPTGERADEGEGAVQEAARKLTEYRNASLLADPSPIGKKALADLTAPQWMALKEFLKGNPRLAGSLLKESPLNPMQLPENLREFWRGLGDTPDIETSVGDVVRASSQSPLGWVARPYSALAHMTSRAMERAGASPEEIGKAIGTSTPETPMGRWVYGGQKYPIMRWLRPFAKVGTNIMEGARNIPFVAPFAGDPADWKQRAAIGGLQMALGAGSEAYDEARRQQGEPVSPLTDALTAASMGVQGVAPFAAGKGLASYAMGGPAKALMELIRLVPGSQAALPEMYPNESADAYVNRVLFKNPIAQMVPSALMPEKGGVR